MRKLLNTLFVINEDAYLTLDGENLVVTRNKQETHRYALHTLEGIVCFTYAGASPALMGACARRGIDLCFFDPYGRFQARTVGEERGNVLLGKKCFALRIASYLGKNEMWQAEHMLILGLQKPSGEIKYLCAAFPSACGKTNLAMLIPPEGYQKKGYKIWTVGDDIAWIRKGPDGRLYAINPENGFFGVAPGTNMKSNPNALKSTMSGTIFTNVCHNMDNNTVWWEGLDKNPPTNAIDWKGNPWNGQTSDEKGAHPNSRFTAPAKNCPCISPEFENPQGVPISAFIFGGRRAKLTPLVYQSKSWNHGVFVGSVMGSETTAAATGAVGVIRRDPMAMLPFCGYNMGDYWKHWIEIGQTLDPDKAPKIFNVNWFRKDDEGNFLWPGFGDNMRVLDWIVDRCEGKVDAQETAIGYLPYAKDINREGLDMTEEQLDKILDVDKDAWEEELKGVEELYAKFGDHLPKEQIGRASCRERV